MNPNIGAVLVGAVFGLISGLIVGSIFEPVPVDWRGLLGAGVVTLFVLAFGFMLVPQLFFGSYIFTVVVTSIISYYYKKSLKNK